MTKTQIYFLTFLFFLPFWALSQNKDSLIVEKKLNWFPKKMDANQKGSFYFYWGYNRAKFRDSNIHFSGQDYDFTLFDVQATDRPSPFSFKQYFTISNFTIPQYNYRLGYRLTQNWGVSLGIDHMKYVATQHQEVRISGVISENISEKYAGAYLNESIILSEDFLQYEHTDGLNLVTLDFEYLMPILRSRKGKIKLKLNTGIGGIWVVAKTKVNILGEGLDNDFHVAGFSLAGKIGPRIDLWERFFISSEFKTGYMAVPDVLIENAEPKYADQTIIFFEFYTAVGVLFRLGRG